ncbi:GNAT family N-acetyltransferase [Aerococcaceae bacterium DSM 111021]|nr:GNAT family N-acetyltransferase [Aerococcaceae bacterium DSM 111021]
MEFKLITENEKTDLNIPNEPFELYGKLIIDFNDGQWTHREELSEEVVLQTFPDENYSYEEIKIKGFAIGAYKETICVGLAIFEHHWNKYMYLMDLKVSKDFRRLGIAQNLLKMGLKQAIELEYAGIYTIGQNNNLSACKFYLNNGFEIGGYNHRDYDYTRQAGKSDIYFYLEGNIKK